MNVTSQQRHSRPAPRAARSLVAGGMKITAVVTLAVLASACKHVEDNTRVAGWSLVDASQRHPILVSKRPSTLNVAVHRGSSGLSPRQRADVLDFAAHYRAADAGNSRLIVAAPGGSANEVSALNAVHEIRAILGEQGFDESSIAVEVYPAEGAGAAPVKVSYLRYVAEAPECGAWPENLARDPSNVPYANFGCATQRNFAMHVANPADLLGPRTMTARSGERRDTTFNKYIKGDITTAKKTADERINTQGD